METERPLRLLVVEDSEDDVLLLLRELKKAGLNTEAQRVESLDEVKRALESGRWDAVISDFNLPGFDGLDVLRLVQDAGLDLPFLLVSGVVGEERAVEAMKAGVHDYIMKGRWARLAPALQRELREAELRRERRRAEKELAKYREGLEALVAERTAELEKANRVLLELQKEREIYTHTISHDLRAPLSAIHGHIQLLGFVCEGEEAKEHIDAVLQGGGEDEPDDPGSCRGCPP